MALPRTYLTSTKNLASILSAIASAQAPQSFTVRFLESLDFKSNNDRLFIGVFQSLGFLGPDKKPTERYFKYLDQTQSAIVLAEAIQSAYVDLFQVNKNAHLLAKQEVVNKFKTLSQGQFSPSVIDKMAMTFCELCKLADFTAKPSPETPMREEKKPEVKIEDMKGDAIQHKRVSLGGLHYNINLILPESRDAAVYDVLFRSLKEHLL